MQNEIKIAPEQVASEYRRGNDYKNALGDKGIAEQCEINARFYIGDQWHGAKCGNDRPLVRRNIIKRIGEYKISTVTAAPVAVNFTAEGIADNAEIRAQAEQDLRELSSGLVDFSGETQQQELSVIARVLSDYFSTTAERVGFARKCEQAVKNAYISGTAVAYSYWDDSINTGLYIDSTRRLAIKGDVGFEILDIRNVCFADGSNLDVQTQPYIIISQKRNWLDVRREAERYGADKAQIEKILPDNDSDFSSIDNANVTVYTKLYKVWDRQTQANLVYAVRTTEKATVRAPWDLKIGRYPVAVMEWMGREGSIYGESEITYLIPNQIAINRAASANIWSIMTSGMPMTLVNGDVVNENITNNPGQIIKVFGANEDIAGAVRHIQPPAFSSQMLSCVESLAQNTLYDSGANDAALGNVRPDNAAAIIQIREAALQPMQMHQNRYYAFVEDIARIWADFWLGLYGDRMICAENQNGRYMIPFHAQRYKNALLSVRVDVGAAALWSTSVTVGALDRLLESGLITFKQYLERIPAGIIPDKTGLLKALKESESSDIQDELARAQKEGDI